MTETRNEHIPIGGEAHRYAFFQLVRLLSARHPGAPLPGVGFEHGRERVRVRPDVGQVFPPGDVRAVEHEDDPHAPAVVTVTFGGLYGIDSPLPASFHERLSSRPEQTGALRDFLDLFNSRFYTYFWRAWARYRPELLPAGSGLREQFDGRLRALTGLATPGAAPPPVDGRLLLGLAGRLSAWARNAEGLRVLLEVTTGLPVRVHENVPRRVALAERPQLGRAKLGQDAVVGSHVKDASGHFRLEIGPLSLPAFLELLPGRDGAARIGDLVRLYAPDYLDYDLDLVLDSADVPPLRLGQPESSRLGLTACVGRPRQPHLHRIVRLAA